jgi:D-glycero-D-manno-heptose 1,7-bisphosphate phosphatase
MTPLVIASNRQSQPRRRAVFLGRDGVINSSRPEGVTHWNEFRFLPRVLDALRRLATLDADLVLVSHQPAIGRGRISVEAVYEIHRQMAAEIEHHGGRIDAIYVCPHAPTEVCGCRLPQPGLLMLAAADRGLNLGQSYMVGGYEEDALAGQAVGCRSVLLADEPKLVGESWPLGLHVTRDLYQAALDIEAEITHPDDRPWNKKSWSGHFERPNQDNLR